jgi:hypothetical protein
LVFLGLYRFEGRADDDDDQPITAPSARRERTCFSSEPKTDQQNENKRRQKEPRDQNHLDSQFANGRNVVAGYTWISTEEPLPISEDVNNSK